MVPSTLPLRDSSHYSHSHTRTLSGKCKQRSFLVFEQMTGAVVFLVKTVLRGREGIYDHNRQGRTQWYTFYFPLFVFHHIAHCKGRFCNIVNFNIHVYISIRILFILFSSAHTHRHTALHRDVQDIMDRSMKEELYSALYHNKTVLWKAAGLKEYDLQEAVLRPNDSVSVSLGSMSAVLWCWKVR